MEQQLAVISQPTELQAGFKPWSRGLGSLLLQEGADGPSDRRASAIRLIAINPTLRAEAERLLPRLEEAKVPASRDEIIGIVMREMPAWGVSTKHAGELGVTFASYADTLEGLSAYAVEEGIARWNRGEGHKDLAMGGFPPRPAQLFALASEGKRELYMAAYRAKLALEYAEDITPRQIDPEQAAKVAADFRDLAASLKAKPMPEAPRPHMSQHAMAEQLRRSDAQARQGGAPISRSHFEAGDQGEVL